MYTLDTNFIIYFLEGEPEAKELFEAYVKSGISLYISAITEAELFSFRKIQNEEDEEPINNILRSLFILPIDSQIARRAGKLRRTHNMSLADSLIAATAMFTGSTLLTRNVRDFKKVEGLKLQKI